MAVDHSTIPPEHPLTPAMVAALHTGSSSPDFEAAMANVEKESARCPGYGVPRVHGCSYDSSKKKVVFNVWPDKLKNSQMPKGWSTDFVDQKVEKPSS